MKHFSYPAIHTNKRVAFTIATVSIVFLLAGGILLARSAKTTSSPLSLRPTPPPVPQEIRSLIAAVGKQTALPPDETPTVATVTNVTRLQDQPFFAKARNGDKVLIYAQAKKAVLYRPATGEIIQISPLEIVSSDAAASSSAQTASSSPVLKITF